MILPNDILLRETSNGQTVWVSQRLVVEVCNLSDEYIRLNRIRYKQTLPSSWQKVSDQAEFMLGDSGKGWRWGKKNGQYYYDYDRIPNRKPCFYRDMLPTKDELISKVDENRLRGSRERQAEQRRTLISAVENMIDNSDITYYMNFKIGDKHIFNKNKSHQLAESVAWCKFIRQVMTWNT